MAARYNSGEGESSFELSQETGSKDTRFFKLPFVMDEKTQKYIKFAKVMIIFQGVDYKTEIIQCFKAMHEKYKQACHEISEYSYKKQYHCHEIYDRDEFYEFCKHDARKAFEMNTNLIVVGQFQREQSLIKYFLYLAQGAKYLVLVYPPIVSENFNIGEPRSRIQSYNIKDHFFCGWFLNDVDSEALREFVGIYFSDCYSMIPEFKKAYNEIDPKNNYESYYGLDVKMKNLAYCIMTIFSGEPSAFHYFRKPEVMKEYGKMSRIFIVGLVFSPFMIAARVKVTFPQKELYGLKDEIRSERELSHAPLPSLLLENSKIDLNVPHVLTASKCNRTIKHSGKKIHDPLQHVRGRGRAAHIVLGKSKVATAKNVDYDVLTAITRESRAAQDDVLTHEVKSALVKKFGQYWVVYLNESIEIDAMFGSCFKVS